MANRLFALLGHELKMPHTLGGGCDCSEICMGSRRADGRGGCDWFICWPLLNISRKYTVGYDT